MTHFSFLAQFGSQRIRFHAFNSNLKYFYNFNYKLFKFSVNWDVHMEGLVKTLSSCIFIRYNIYDRQNKTKIRYTLKKFIQPLNKQNSNFLFPNDVNGHVCVCVIILSFSFSFLKPLYIYNLHVTMILTKVIYITILVPCTVQGTSCTYVLSKTKTFMLNM